MRILNLELNKKKRNSERASERFAIQTWRLFLPMMIIYTENVEKKTNIDDDDDDEKKGDINAMK